MELQKALAQISDIHAQVLRSEVFRGYRAVTMLATGGIAVAAAAAQATLVPPADLIGFVLYWILVACVCAGVSAADLILSSRHLVGHGLRRRTLMVVSQSLPALAVGALVTGILMYLDRDLAVLLPGLWVMLYSLSLFAARPYLPRAIGWVGAFYLAAGAFLLWRVESGAIPSPWGLGLAFGIGQGGLAVVFYLNIERPNGERQQQQDTEEAAR
ncbi:MAG: hypothetical protein ACYTGW_20530 [Planctomycetota bacterium]|jgi:hypothetical protein